MYFAISVLCIIGIASVIGTVLQQNKPYTDYIIKFGSYWHEVFLSLGLYDVYSTVWFLTLVFFLVVSTSTCIYRNTPTMLREYRQYRENAKSKTLKTMRHVQTYTGTGELTSFAEQCAQFLTLEKYKFKIKKHDDYQLIAAKKGSLNRIGYIMTHVGMVVIMVFAFIDGKFHLTWKEWVGGKQIEKRSIPIEEIPSRSKFAVNELVGFRGVANIPEGETHDFVAISQRDGYYIQALPFTITLKDFHIDYYETGMPSAFKSDLVIKDKDSGKSFEHTISVNHPLIHRGYAIFQASFEDGGSKLDIKAWPVASKDTRPIELSGIIREHKDVQTHLGKYTLEFQDFKPINVFPNEDPDIKKKFKNMGPSFVYRLRDATGQAREYTNYMIPVMQDGRAFFLTGMRASVTEEYRFLHIPIDDKGGIERFIKFQAVLNNDELLRRITQTSVKQSLKGSQRDTPEMQQQVAQSMFNLVKIFVRGGYVALDEEIRNKVPKEKQEQVAGAYIKVLENALQNVYLVVLRDEGINLADGMNAKNGQFFEDAVNAIAGIGAYGSPFILQLTNFTHREASGLQISRAPGQKYVYVGCVMLIIGVFMMFYINHQRIWIMLRPNPNPDQQNGNKMEILVAGMGNRHEADFNQFFIDFNGRLQQAVPEIKSQQEPNGSV